MNSTDVMVLRGQVLALRGGIRLFLDAPTPHQESALATRRRSEKLLI